MYRSTNPATGVVEAEFPTLTPQEIADAAERSAQVYPAWRATPLATRAQAMSRLADIFEARSEQYAQIITQEMGKPITQAKGELKTVAAICRYYADNAEELLADEVLDPASGDHAVVRTTPIGPILGIMPWNFPFYQVARLAVPNLLLGNTILLKHASNCPLSAQAFEAAVQESGVPTDAYINLLAKSRDIEALIASPHVQGVSLTGSERAGASVASQAGENLKKVVLELGGSDPLLVLDSEDLDSSVTAALFGRFSNAGQACISAKRLIVLDDVYDEFSTAYAQAVSQMSYGDPTDPETFMGPLYSAEAKDELHEILDDALEQGAELLVGADVQRDDTAFMAPMVLTKVTPEMRAFRDEIFGPIAVLLRARDADHAVELANDSDLGLGATIFGADSTLVNDIADRLDTGMVVINGRPGGQPNLPFGGTKRSGFGRELGAAGIAEFSNKKLIRTPA